MSLIYIDKQTYDNMVTNGDTMHYSNIYKVDNDRYCVIIKR